MTVSCLEVVVPDAILTLNAGSSSIKFATFLIDEATPRMTSSGRIEGIGTAPHLLARDADGGILAEHRWKADETLNHEAFLDTLLDLIEKLIGEGTLVGVGHRVVHGGPQFGTPVRVTSSLLDSLNALTPLAPLQQPHNLAAIKAVADARPSLPQIACFDTAFHREQPPVSTRFALPRTAATQDIRRYGFHGISYEYIGRRLKEIDARLASSRVVVAHLGNGASLCAIRDGKSIETTMGFTPLDGLMMGTRCGAIDAGVLLYLLEQKGMTAEALSHLLYEQSGLLGVSGISSDMRALLEAADPHAAEAIDLFVYRVARETAALAAALDGLDCFVFTAGIGENAPEIRAKICMRMAWLGVTLDKDANARGAVIISAPTSRVVVLVVPTDEERMIAIHTSELLGYYLEQAKRPTRAP